MSNRLAPLLALVLAVTTTATAGVAHAKPSPRPPDPRHGERLDGRAPPRDPWRFAKVVPRALLFVPRMGAKLVFMPLVAASAAAERIGVVDRVKAMFISADGQSGVRPSARYVSGVAGVGLSYWDKRLFGPDSRVEIGGNVAGEHRLGGRLSISPRPGVDLTLKLERRDDERFAGAHGETRAELAAAGHEVSRFGWQRAYGRVVVERRLASALLVGVRGDLETRVFEDGAEISGDPGIQDVWTVGTMGEVDAELVPGWDDPRRRARAGANVLLGKRPGRFESGLTLELDGIYAEGFAGDPSRDATVGADARLPIAFGDRALTLHVAAGTVEPLGDAPVPFVDLLSPVGTNELRGLTNGLLRGASTALVSLEYRWLIAGYYDASVFVDYGGAFSPRFDNFARERLVTTVGVGLVAFDRDRSNRYWHAGRIGALYLAWNEPNGVSLIFSTSE